MAMPLYKKPRLSVSPTPRVTSLANDRPSLDSLSGDELAHIFSFLSPETVLLTRLNKKLRDSVSVIAIPTEYRVHRFQVLEVMSTAMPNLQHITLDNLGASQKYVDGEDPDEELVGYTHEGRYHADQRITRDITILTRFKNLRVLELNDAPLNGRYPFLFKLPLLQTLVILHCRDLKWDLELLSGLRSLKELFCEGSGVTGDISDLKALKGTIEILDMHNCCAIKGDIESLSDFPRLTLLDLGGASGIVGDVRQISDDDFQAVEELYLPKGVVGGKDHEFQYISEVAEVMAALHRLKQRIPSIIRDCYWKLDAASPEWYDVDFTIEHPAPPFVISFVQAGTRNGWRWLSPSRPMRRMDRALQIHDIQSKRGCSCEVNWLDKEPDRESCDYETYIQEKQSIDREVDFYKDYWMVPPTLIEYQKLCNEATAD